MYLRASARSACTRAGRAFSSPAQQTFNLCLDSSFIDTLPADKSSENVSRRVVGAAYSHVRPKSVSNPEILLYNESLAKELGFPDLEQQSADQIAKTLSGCQLISNYEPWAACYGGHQFGTWAGQLGDGRAITIAEIISKENEHFEVQLKGAGTTPYSRFADGRAVLRSSVREYIASEAMHALGIPTTRALCLVKTGDSIARDMFYNGNVQFEPGAIVTRVAQSFLRIGSLEIHFANKDHDLMKKVLDYTIQYQFPHIWKRASEEERYVELYREVINLNARLCALWHSVGFTHGVLNTDNVSLLGLTIDYGPYGFVERYDPHFTPNLSDAHSRYSYGNQTSAMHWDLMCLGRVLSQLISVEALQKELDAFQAVFTQHWEEIYAKKFGFNKWSGGLSENQEAYGDTTLFAEFSKLLHSCGADHTNAWRALSTVPTTGEVVTNAVEKVIRECDVSGVDTKEWEEWLQKYQKRLQREERDEAERMKQQCRVNPKFIPRNYQMHAAITAAAEGDYAELQQLLHVVTRPFEEDPLQHITQPSVGKASDESWTGLQQSVEVYTHPAHLHEWTSKPGVCKLSCSS